MRFGDGAAEGALATVGTNDGAGGGCVSPHAGVADTAQVMKAAAAVRERVFMTTADRTTSPGGGLGE